LPVARRLLRVIDGANLEQARRQLSGDAAKLARSKGGKALLSAAKLGDDAIASFNSAAPRQHLMLDSVISSELETSTPDQDPMLRDCVNNTSFFQGMKDVQPFVPVVNAPVMQPLMQPYIMSGWALCQTEDGKFLVPGQQQMVQVPETNDTTFEPWWSSTVAEVSAIWCSSAPEQASMMIE